MHTATGPAGGATAARSPMFDVLLEHHHTSSLALLRVIAPHRSQDKSKGPCLTVRAGCAVDQLGGLGYRVTLTSTLSSRRQAGGVAEDEMFRTFNMGIGMLVVVGRESAGAARAADAGALVLGEVVAGRGVQLV